MTERPSRAADGRTVGEPPDAARRPGAAGGRTWWSTRLLGLLEGMAGPEPLRAGRVLADTEGVLSVRRSGNLVVAIVRDRAADPGVSGSRAAEPGAAEPGAAEPRAAEPRAAEPRAAATPRVEPRAEEMHKARLAVRTFGDADWGRVEEALAGEARHAAALLAGSMPPDIEEPFARFGLALFPTGAHDLAMDCTCRDWQRPCAHLLAACHHLADTLDHDPFALLGLRGRERDAILAEIRRLRPRAPAPPTRRTYAWPLAAARLPATRPASGDDSPEPLPASWAQFWSVPTGAAPAATPEPPGGLAPARPGVLLDLCGPLVVEPFGDLREVLRPLYDQFTSDARAAG